MFTLTTLALLIAVFGLLKYFSIKRPFIITLMISLVISIISTISLWLNYKASFSEQDGIAISNQLSYWIITDGTRWTQDLFKDYFIYSLVVTTLIAFIIVSLFAIKRTRIT